MYKNFSKTIFKKYYDFTKMEMTPTDPASPKVRTGGRTGTGPSRVHTIPAI